MIGSGVVRGDSEKHRQKLASTPGGGNDFDEKRHGKDLGQGIDSFMKGGGGASLGKYTVCRD